MQGKIKTELCFKTSQQITFSLQLENIEKGLFCLDLSNKRKCI